MTNPPPEVSPEPKPAPEPKIAGRAFVYRGEGTGLFQRLTWDAGRVLSRIITLLLFGLRVQGQSNIPKTGAVLLITNHQSFLDPWIIGIRLRRQIHYMARDSLFKRGFLGWLMELLNSYPVKRGAADLQAIRMTVERLEQGRVVNIFPEGTRTADGAIGPVAPGIVLILNRVKTPLTIVPVVIDGAFESWPRRNKFPHPHFIRIAYGQPLLAGDLKGLQADQVALRLRQRLVELQEQMHSAHAALSRQKLDADIAKPPEAGRRRGR